MGSVFILPRQLFPVNPLTSDRRGSIIESEGHSRQTVRPPDLVTEITAVRWSVGRLFLFAADSDYFFHKKEDDNK